MMLPALLRPWGACYLLLILLCMPNWTFAYEYTLRWLAPHTHTLVIELRIEPSEGDFTDIQIPSWRPGRYMLQDYAAAVSHFEAQDAQGASLSWEKTTPSTWRISNSSAENGPLIIRYRYYADNQDAGSSYYGTDQIYINPINAFAFVPGKLEQAVELDVPDLPESWVVATALPRDGNTFQASSYHAFADAPMVMAPSIHQLSFELEGITFFMHFHGEYQGNDEVDQALLEGVKKICLEQKAVFGDFPFESYHFIYRLLPYNMRHAVEHANSSCYALPASVTRSVKAATSGVLGITSHEFWHVWNVKRIRPAALVPYDYSGPQYTRLHWFTEGVTDYYSHLTLVRAGLIDEANFLGRMARNIQNLENSYASQVVSPSDASFDSWLATSPYAHPHHQVSYYGLGGRLGFLLDLKLQHQSGRKHSLDDLFRWLHETYYLQGQGVPEDGVQLGLEALTGDSWQTFFDQHVHQPLSFDYESLLEPFGLILEEEEDEAGGAKQLGITEYQGHSQGIYLVSLHPGGDFAQAGVNDGALLIRINGTSAVNMDLDQFANKLKRKSKLEVLVFDGSQLKELSLVFEGKNAPRSYRLLPNEQAAESKHAARKAWLAPNAPKN